MRNGRLVESVLGTVAGGAGLGIMVILMDLFMIHGKLQINGYKFEIRRK
jgi:hypothetical protein